ncbi:vanadium-dependent haloperoxidase [Parvularcula dongshanensis]|uniref:Membrane-associated phospholipid phosphatase n=1 Tax=Parvularcula dongshanensis TaxID=1173995 RepID=A0A840I271_9PROT|nr:vanadium-dependent haloperoxidase [Parvularcula dongshanensis]MBB4658334.1 membrane-associated phospholipid phosphatase [Parvularcula dongshanensis]
MTGTKDQNEEPRLAGRRRLLRGVTAGAGVLAAGAALPAAAKGRARASLFTRATHPVLADSPLKRASDALRLRLGLARDAFDARVGAQATNGDEAAHEGYCAMFTKALPHDALGHVDPPAYERLLDALRQNSGAAYDRIPLGGPRKLANPEAAYDFAMAGLDGQALRMRPAPGFASEETAGEVLELYWKALLRDRPFLKFGSDPLVARAASDMNAFAHTAGGPLTPLTAFRGETAGDRVGPYVSQFLLRDVPFGNSVHVQRYASPPAGADWGTSWDEWLFVQNGGVPGTPDLRGARFIHDGRSLAAYVHTDFTYQTYLNAALILLGLGPDAVAKDSPARSSKTTGGFVSFGPADVVDAVAGAAREALHATWFQKWSVHRRLRPEAYSGRLHNQLTGRHAYGLPEALGETDGVGRTKARQGTALLSQTYPEGAPTHPSFPAGHAVIAGACVTMLKAFFEEGFVLPAPVQANEHGTALLPVPNALTVGGELDKLAANVALGRDWAGVHYRSDGIDGLKLGEDVALSLLASRAACYSATFDGFSLTRFDGSRVTIGAGGLSA